MTAFGASYPFPARLAKVGDPPKSDGAEVRDLAGAVPRIWRTISCNAHTMASGYTELP
jgi:hypothetical protein